MNQQFGGDFGVGFGSVGLAGEADAESAGEGGEFVAAEAGQDAAGEF